MADAAKTRSELIMATLIAASLSPKLEKLGIKITVDDVLFWGGVVGYFLHQAWAMFVLYFPPPGNRPSAPLMPPAGAAP